SRLHFISAFSLTTLPTTHIDTLSLHDALPISIISNILILLSMTLVSLREEINRIIATGSSPFIRVLDTAITGYLSYATFPIQSPDRKSTRLNSSHVSISYAVFCLKKKKK